MSNMKTDTRKELVAMQEFDIETSEAIVMLDAGVFDKELATFVCRVSEMADYCLSRS